MFAHSKEKKTLYAQPTIIFFDQLFLKRFYLESIATTPGNLTIDTT